MTVDMVKVHGELRISKRKEPYFPVTAFANALSVALFTLTT